MARLLYVEASPRKDRSASIAVARSFIETYRQVNPDDAVETIDVWQEPLPSFDGNVIDAKYAIYHGEPFTAAQKQAWRNVENVIAQFTAADKYLFALPMWNFNLPYKLKQYIDIIVQPGYTFSFSPEAGFQGLVTGKPAATVYSRAGAYGPASGMAAYDLQKPYLETVLGFIGFEDIRSVVVEGTLAPPDEKGRNVDTAMEQARQTAKIF